MKVKLVNYSQSLAQLFTMYTLGELFNVKLVKRFTKWTFKTLSIGISYQILKAY